MHDTYKLDSGVSFVSQKERRRRRLIMTNAFGFIMNLAMAAAQLITLGSAAAFGMLVCFIISMSTAAGFVCAYRDCHAVTAGRISLYVSSAAIYLEVALSGGLAGYFGHIVIALPVMCALVLGTKDTISLAIVSLVAIMGLLIFNGALPDFEIDKHTYLLASCITLVCTMAGTALIAILLAGEADKAEKALHEALCHQTYLAHHDSLTGLYNRFAVTDHLNQLDAASDRVEVFLIDLDGFKQVNDRYGHAAGDNVLRIVGERLAAILPAARLVARLGGDEFLIAVDVPPFDTEVELGLGKRLAEALDITSGSNGETLHTSASVGSALFPDDTIDPSDLLSKADAALYAAKRNGKNQFIRFREEDSLFGSSNDDSSAGENLSQLAT